MKSFKKGTLEYDIFLYKIGWAERLYNERLNELKIQEEKKKQQEIVKNLPKYNFDSEGNLMIKRMDGIGYGNLGSPNGISRYSYDAAYVIASFSEQVAYYQSKGVRALLNFLRSKQK